eukprot:scaffold38769_cov35-Tisochrysis_lutea.AAC.9
MRNSHIHYASWIEIERSKDQRLAPHTSSYNLWSAWTLLATCGCLWVNTACLCPVVTLGSGPCCLALARLLALCVGRLGSAPQERAIASSESQVLLRMLSNPRALGLLLKQKQARHPRR